MRVGADSPPPICALFSAESGCVSLVGSYLSLKEITVYYLSTAQHDFVLVRSHSISRGTNLLSLSLSLAHVCALYMFCVVSVRHQVPKKHFETALDWLGKKLCSSKPNSITPPPRPPPSPYVHNLVTFPTQLFAARCP
jgi:hypothetical protein